MLAKVTHWYRKLCFQMFSLPFTLYMHVSVDAAVKLVMMVVLSGWKGSPRECSEVKSRLLGAACWLRLGLASVPGLHRILLSHSHTT